MDWRLVKKWAVPGAFLGVGVVMAFLYHLEAAPVDELTNAAASSYRWFRDVVGTDEVAKAEKGGKSAFDQLNELAAASKPGANGVLYLPYLATAATPRWNANARGAYVGMSFPAWEVDGEYELLGVPSDISGKGFMIQAGLFVGTF